VPTIDGLLVATARRHALTLVTRNVTDVEGLGVPVRNPWET
jgi:toxin FitB